MNVTINAHIIIAPSAGELLPLLNEINSRLQSLTEKETQMADALAEKIDGLVAKVTNLSTIEDSMITLLTGLSAMIADLKNGTTDPAQLQRIDDLAATVSGMADKASAALVANTQV